MALNLGPSAWFPDWTATSTHITLPIASLPGLTSAQAGAVSGDVRAVVLGFMEQLYAVYFDLASADKPEEMSITKSISSIDDGTTLRNRYTINLNTEVLTQSVVDES